MTGFVKMGHICQDINMYVGCDLASSVSRRKAAHPGADPVCGGPIEKFDAILPSSPEY